MINASDVIKKALETYIRIHLLQVEYAMEDVLDMETKINPEKASELRRLIKSFEAEVCLNVHGNANVHRGIFSTGVKDSGANAAYQILKDMNGESLLVDTEIDYSGIKIK